LSSVIVIKIDQNMLHIYAVFRMTAPNWCEENSKYLLT
jgi:hypothetical protein